MAGQKIGKIPTKARNLKRMASYQCSKCLKTKPQREFHEAREKDRLRPVTSRCSDCRKEARYDKMFPDSACIQCLKHRKIVLDTERCAECNEEYGLRQCVDCGQLLTSFLAFYGNKTCCRACEKTKRITREAAKAKS